MSFDLAEDLFNPVFHFLALHIDYLSKHTPVKFGKARGLETWFQREIVTPTLTAQGYKFKTNNRGVDLLIHDANSDLLVELKAANDFRVNYVVGLERDGWITKYIEQISLPQFAGCLFLGCEFNDAIDVRLNELVSTIGNTRKMRGHDITLAQHETLATRDKDYYWVIGLLVTPYGRSLLSSK